MLDNSKTKIISDEELENISGGFLVKNDEDAIVVLNKTKSLLETGDMGYLGLCLDYVKSIVANNAAAKMLMLFLSLAKDDNELCKEVYNTINNNLM